MRFSVAILLLASATALSSAAFYTPGENIHRRLNRLAADVAEEKPSLPEKYGPFYLDQPIDHFSLNETTFKHRYWANTDWYQPGGPVILYNAGESPADERSLYVTNSTMAELAKNLNGIVVVMEHRFYGKSLPAPDFSAESLATLTTAQALEDMASFIKFLKFPELKTEIPPAPETKYIVYGGSYSGNLAAWMRQKYPHLVFAAVPSSAPVQMSYNFYQYFDPIRKYGPKHCINAIRATVLYADHILFSPIDQAKKRLKESFGMTERTHDDDFAEALSYPLGLWQEMSPTSNPFVDEFCSLFDDLDTVHDYVKAYGDYVKKNLEKACKDEKSIDECLDTHDPQAPMYHNTTDESRAWLWQVCTEYAYWQTGSPIWRPTIVSRKLNTRWYQRQCPLMFGEHGVPKFPIWRDINKDYDGWYISLSHVYWLDGEWDPWRTLSVQSDDAPKRHGWNEDAKFEVLPESVHHWDFFATDSVSEEIKETQDRVLETIRNWIKEADNDNDGDKTPFNYQHVSQ